jgi:hypothetical protein
MSSTTDTDTCFAGVPERRGAFSSSWLITLTRALQGYHRGKGFQQQPADERDRCALQENHRREASAAGARSNEDVRACPQVDPPEPDGELAADPQTVERQALETLDRAVGRVWEALPRNSLFLVVTLGGDVPQIRVNRVRSCRVCMIAFICHVNTQREPVA